MTTADKVSYEQFRDEWLTEIEEANLSSLEKGRLFATKLITQWLGVTTDDDDFVICDGSRDGGIDIAYLQRADTDESNQDDDSGVGDTWYIVQSKYGVAFAGAATILAEGDKILSTLEGENQHLNEQTQILLQKIDIFLQRQSENDRIVLVFATLEPIDQNARKALDDVKFHWRERITPNFDVEEVSLPTIWESIDPDSTQRLYVSISGRFVGADTPLLVGTVSLSNWFQFLVEYKNKAGNLDQLYEKNVRQFLGNRRKINKGIAETLEENPDLFGLYNNGITIVASEYTVSAKEDIVIVQDPYVVNGCQTTRTIWQVLDGKLYADGTPRSESIIEWKGRVDQGGVVTKIVKSEEANIADITKFTNSQNAVRPQDFIALDSGFQSWKMAMESNHGIYLEIQRGGWEAQKAWEKQHPGHSQFEDHVNAFDLIKVYGAGWMGLPGTAFGKNAPFLPKGSVYERILARPEGDHAFGVRDLFAAYKVKCLADAIGFGRGAIQPSRRQSRFLFYHVMMRMLGEIVRLTPELGQPEITENVLTSAVLKLTETHAGEEWDLLAKAATALIDRYLTVGSDTSAHNEKSLAERHNGDMNAFLKAEDLGKESHSPLLVQAIAIQNAAFSMGGREQVAQALRTG